MKKKILKKKTKGIAERKTETKRQRNIPYKALGMGTILWLLVTWLFFGQGIMPKISYQEGKPFPATIEALVSFSCKSETATKLNKDEAARSIPPIFRLSSLPEKRASRQISVVFDRLEQLASASAEEQEQKRASLDDVLIGLDLEDDADAFIRIFTEDSITETKEILIDSLHRVMGMGVIADEKRENFDNGDPFRPLSIKPETDEPAREATLAAILSMEQAVPIIINPFRNRDQRDLIKKLLNAVMEPNLKYDDDSTKKLRQEAIEAVPVVVKYYTEGDTLVHAGETATIENLALLQAHNTQIQQNRDFSEQAFEVAGNGILLLIGLIAAAVILRTGGGGIVRKIDKLLLLIILSIISLGTAWLLSYLSYHYFALSAELIPYIIPFALVVLLAGILIGENAAIALGFWCSYASAVLLGHSFPVFVLGMMVTVTAASTARNVHRRASLFRAGLWICAVKVIFVLLTFMLTKPPVSTMLWQLGTAVASGVISSVLTILIIPLFEKIFKITTDITLLELSDMGHPLLQKMAMQAPGTYHHSLMVATLAQNAAEAIGANPLLVRVCAYYHDIGKMAKPEFFTENIQHKENPHDELSPHMSALVISSHVKEGLALAKRHKLPQPIFEAIEQHHGNGLISFFHHKARQQAEETGESVNESDFRYGGDPAISKEMSILALADSSEAASRSIEKPTPQKISNMLDSIFSGKIKDGQLDYANLTMAEIKTVKQSFIFSLSNMLHGRIPYPKDNENKHPKPTEKPSDSTQKAKTAD